MPSRVLPDGRRRLAELTASVGAGILGFGLGAFVAQRLRIDSIPAILIGLGLHTWGMFDKHRLESGAVVETWWSRTAYWACWILLASLIGLLALRGLNR